MACDIENYFSGKKELIDSALRRIFSPEHNGHTKLSVSMRYSILAGGKRIRPVLCLACCETFDGDLKKAIPVACAIEMVHTYSLIHDDLPSMDNDDMRRGVPTNHKVYGDAAAILAGDALLTDAFNLIVREGRIVGIKDATLLDIIDNLSRAAGSEGMIQGQMIDIEAKGSDDIKLEKIKRIHSLKTGKLIEASVISGALVGGASGPDLKNLRDYSSSIGLVYQIIDDLIDDTNDLVTGKTKGSDAKNDKPTFNRDEVSEQLVAELTDKASLSLKKISRDTLILEKLTRYLESRIC